MNETTRLLRDLVALPSVNPMGRDLTGPDFLEARVTAYLEDFFRDLGVRWERQPVAPKRDNILAWYEPPGANAYPCPRSASGHGAHRRHDHRPFWRPH